MPKLKNKKSPWEGYVSPEVWETMKKRNEAKRYIVLDPNAHEAPNDEVATDVPAEAQAANYTTLIVDGDGLKESGDLEGALAKYEQAKTLNNTAKIRNRIKVVEKLITDAAAATSSEGSDGLV